MGLLLKGTNRFFHGMGKGARAFGAGIARHLGKPLRFLAKEVAPVAQRIAGGIGTAASFIAPALLASGVGAEFAPIVAGIGVGAKAAERGIAVGRKAYAAGEAAQGLVKKASSVVNTIGKVKVPSIEKVVSGRVKQAISSGVMKINRPPTLYRDLMR